jgi:hypothetical protein
MRAPAKRETITPCMMPTKGSEPEVCEQRDYPDRVIGRERSTRQPGSGAARQL